MNHHFRGDMNKSYTGRKSYLPTMAGFGTHPRVTLPIILFAVLAVIAIAGIIAKPFLGG